MVFNDIYRGLITGTEKLALVGLGYVGMPIAVEFAKHVKVLASTSIRNVSKNIPMELMQLMKLGQQLRKLQLNLQRIRQN